MATHRAVEAACRALTRQLADARPAELPQARFAVRLPGGKEPPGRPGRTVSVLPYQVLVDRSTRSPGRGPRPLLVQVRILVVVGGSDPEPVLDLVGWVLRTLHDHPVLLPATTADPAREPVFGEDERLQVTVDDLARDELLEVCTALGLTARGGLALPYVLTGLSIDG